MTQYKSLNVKLSNSRLNKVKFGIKNDNEVTLKLSANVVGDSIDKRNFLHKLLLTNTLVSKLRKSFPNGLLTNIKLSKIQLHKIGQSERFLDRALGPLLKTGMFVIKNVLKPLAKSVLIPLGLTAGTSATDAAIHKKMFVSSTTTSVIPNEEMNYIIEIIKSLEESGY